MPQWDLQVSQLRQARRYPHSAAPGCGQVTPDPGQDTHPPDQRLLLEHGGLLQAHARATAAQGPQPVPQPHGDRAAPPAPGDSEKAAAASERSWGAATGPASRCGDSRGPGVAGRSVRITPWPVTRARPEASPRPRVYGPARFLPLGFCLLRVFCWGFFFLSFNSPGANWGACVPEALRCCPLRRKRALQPDGKLRGPAAQSRLKKEGGGKPWLESQSTSQSTSLG